MRLGTSSNARFLGGFAEESWVLGGGDLGSVRNGIGICAGSSNSIGSRMEWHVLIDFGATLDSVRNGRHGLGLCGNCRWLRRVITFEC